MKETTLQTPRSVEKEGEECARDVGAESLPLDLVMKTMVRQVSPCRPWRSMVEQISTCSLWRTPYRSRQIPKGSCDPVESPRWSRLLAGHVAQWRERSPCWSRFALRACDPVGDPRWRSLFLKDCTPWKGPTLEQFVKSCSPWEGFMLEQCVENCLL